MEKSAKQKEHEKLNEIKVPKLWRSTRLTIMILLFFAIFHTIWLRFCFSLAMVCMTGTDNNSTDPGYIEGEFRDEWSNETVALLLSSFFYGYMCTQVLGGYLADKFGEKWSLLGGMFLMGLLSVLIPPAARLHWAALMVVRILQGMVTGFSVPATYTSVATWSSPVEKGTLTAMVFAASPVCQIFNAPVSGLLCYSGVDNGWPLIFYIPGATSMLWTAFYYFLASNTPENHPRIDEEEKLYLQLHSCRKVNAKSGGSKKRKLNVPWIKMLLSVPIHALWIAQLSAAWVRYQASLNLPIFINETFDLGIVYVSKIRLHYFMLQSFNYEQNGFLSGLPYVGVLLINFSGKLYDVINKRQYVSTNVLRKIFTTISLGVPAILYCFIIYADNLGKILILTAATMVNQLGTTGGYFISHSDVVGPYAAILFGTCNTLAMVLRFGSPLIITTLAPNVSNNTKTYVFHCEYYLQHCSHFFTFIQYALENRLRVAKCVLQRLWNIRRWSTDLPYICSNSHQPWVNSDDDQEAQTEISSTKSQSSTSLS